MRPAPGRRARQRVWWFRCAGGRGWQDKQLPDGTLILTSPTGHTYVTSPTGHTYVTTPGSALLFPSLCQPTAAMPAPQADPPRDHRAQRTAMMPQRRRTRAQDRAHRIATEPRHNRQARLAQTTQPGPAPPDDNEPPPF
jgi:hypothetical protein